MKKSEYLEKTNLPKRLVNAVINQFGGWESFLESYKDVIRHGISAGFGSFIYYKDTLPFAKKYKNEIIQVLKEKSYLYGMNILNLVASFGFFKDHPMDEETELECYRYLGGKINKNDIIIPNLMAWFAAETICYDFSVINDEI